MAYGVKANIKAPHRFLRMGSLCWLSLPNPGGGADRIMVVGMSRGGRKATTWVDSRDLNNFRPGWISNPDAMPYRHTFQSKEDAQDWSDSMSHRYGEQPVRAVAARHGRPLDNECGGAKLMFHQTNCRPDAQSLYRATT